MFHRCVSDALFAPSSIYADSSGVQEYLTALLDEIDDAGDDLLDDGELEVMTVIDYVEWSHDRRRSFQYCE